MITVRKSSFSTNYIAKDNDNVMSQRPGISEANAIARVKHNIANAGISFTIMKPEKIK